MGGTGSLTLGLVDHGPHEEDANETESAPEEEDFTLQVGVAWTIVDEVRCGVGDRPVQQPVTRRRHRQRLGSDLQWENLTSHNPCNRSPRAGEEEDVDAHESDESFLRGFVLDSGSCADAGDDELRDCHADGAEEEEGATTPGFDEVEAGEG